MYQTSSKSDETMTQNYFHNYLQTPDVTSLQMQMQMPPLPPKKNAYDLSNVDSLPISRVFFGVQFGFGGGRKTGEPGGKPPESD